MKYGLQYSYAYPDSYPGCLHYSSTIDSLEQSCVHPMFNADWWYCPLYVLNGSIHTKLWCYVLSESALRSQRPYISVSTTSHYHLDYRAKQYPCLPLSKFTLRAVSSLFAKSSSWLACISATTIQRSKVLGHLLSVRH